MEEEYIGRRFRRRFHRGYGGGIVPWLWGAATAPLYNPWYWNIPPHYYYQGIPYPGYGIPPAPPRTYARGDEDSKPIKCQVCGNVDNYELFTVPEHNDQIVCGMECAKKL